MRTSRLALLFILPTYLVAWLSMYMWVMDGDMSYLAEYFRLGWFEGGGELPGLIQLYALLLTAGISAFAFLVVWARRRMSKTR
jgi:hypothetical protein